MSSENADSQSSADDPNSTTERRVIKIGTQRPGHEIVPPSQDVDVPLPPMPPNADELDHYASEPAAEVSVEQAAAAEPKSETPPMDKVPAETPLAEGATIAPKKFPLPRVTRISDDLQTEIDAALSDVSMDELMSRKSSSPEQTLEPEIDQRYRVPVVKIHRDDVFFALNGHFEGVASLRQFDTVPEPGMVMEVVVNKFNSDEGLYEVSVPSASMQVQDWSDLDEGITVEAVITAHNSGGLECEVNKIRGFIPVSQISNYRVEDLEQFVGDKFVCIVTEANPARGNLVLSRRAVLEREQAAAKEKLLESLEEGQVREGIVRKIMDFGAFVDIGGTDGLIHVSRLSWDRVKHPSEVVEEGQKVKVKIEKIDEATGKIGLSLRDTVPHPWEAAKGKYVENTVVTGVVSKIMDFGAFIRLEPGIEGLVHISELAHHRVVRVSNVVQEGQEVSVKILSIDPDSQRISLSMKAIQAVPVETSNDKAAEAEEDEPPRESAVKKFEGRLRGGTNKRTGGADVGLKW